MDAKIALTSRCNARCATCPVWTLDGEDMPVEAFAAVWAKLCWHPGITKIILGSIGELYVHPRHGEIVDIVEARQPKMTVLITNGSAMDRVPRVALTVVSFNGVERDGYERTTGLDFEATRANIRSHYKALAENTKAELHCLIWQGNAVDGYEEKLRELWADFPGRVRLSVKYDNQFREDRGVAPRPDRVPCDYLDMLIVDAKGQVIMCSHDFASSTVWGDLRAGEVEDMLFGKDRAAKRREHKAGVYSGLCERCNYNTPTDGRIRYVKER